MDTLFVALFEILSFGAIVVLVVLGLGIIASMMGIFNFAHGEFVLLGAYTVYLLANQGLPVWFGMLAAPVAVAIVGVALERTVIRRFYAAPIVAMLGTYAIALVLREGVRMLLGGSSSMSSRRSWARSNGRGVISKWRPPSSDHRLGWLPAICC
jgi:branched-chain amino acid transport system permease protein